MYSDHEPRYMELVTIKVFRTGRTQLFFTYRFGKDDSMQHENWTVLEESAHHDEQGQ